MFANVEIHVRGGSKLPHSKDHAELDKNPAILEKSRLSPILKYNDLLMSHIESISKYVSHKIQSRGKEYFLRGAVDIQYYDAKILSAQVAGSQKYDVDLERDRDVLFYACTCPYFEENQDICKHVWATLLEAERQGVTKKWGSMPIVDLIPQEMDDDYYEPDIDGEEEAYDDYDLDIPPPKAEIVVSPPPSPWMQILKKMSGQRKIETPPLIWPAGREILYVLDSTRGFHETALTIHIDFRDRKKNGEWKQQQPLTLSHDSIAAIPDPADREILSKLAGLKRQTWSYIPGDHIYRFEPKRQDLLAFLPILSNTGRLYFRSYEFSEMRLIRWDGAGPWEFRLCARPDEQGRQYEICGAFYRAGERIELHQMKHIYREGIFISSETVASYEGPHDWISLCRQEGSFFVPFSDADQLLETMLAMPSLPSMDLPEELQLQEIEAEPRPIMRIRSHEELWGARSLLGELYFDYAGHEIGEPNPATGIALVKERLRIMRKPDAEKAAVQKIEETGFKRQTNYRTQLSWTISQSQLPRAVRNLLALGWHVEAEGKLFRNPGSMNFQLSSGIDWFELHGSVDFGGARVALPRLLSSLKRRENTILLDDGSFGMLPETWLRKYGMLAGLGTAQEDHVRFSRAQAGLLDAMLASEPEVTCDGLFERVRAELHSFEGIAPATPPEGFQGVLRPYQSEGLGWLHFLRKFGFGGCLADDMGLGKTIQVLALLESRRASRDENESAGSRQPSLVVVPRSLVFNWQQEAARFTPQLSILDHTGADRTRGHEHFDDYDVVLTTYGTLRRDAVFFSKKTFDYVILDEAQAIKNSTTESAKAARLLHAKCRLALSGTPIENHLGELWSLFEFLNPGMLGAASVFKMGKGSKIDEEQRLILARALRPFILRRTKAQVASDLPEKVEQTLFCRLEAPQRALYDELREHYRRSLLKRVEKDGMEKSKIYVLEALLRLRQAAIHPGLIDRSRIDEPSAKLDALLPQLAEVLDEGHKALVFSQFTSMLGILRRWLDKDKIRYEYLDGETRDRQAPVERFQNDPDAKLFLISLKAGGLGLNLTAAEYVFLLDPWWNPAVEAQAIDRTHRIGQTRSVFAYRLIAKDTVEEKVLLLQNSKREIADAIINQDNSLLRDLGPEDLALLLS